MTSKEQYIYGKILKYCTFLAIALLITTFAIYASGVITPYTSPQQLTEYLTYDRTEIVKEAPLVGEYISLTQYSEFLLYIPLLVLALCTLVCFVAITPIFIRNKDKPYVVIAVLEIILLIYAALWCSPCMM